LGNKKMVAVSFSCVLSVGLSAASLFAADWPQWRGPDRDGIVHGVKSPEVWPETLREQWKVKVGEGASSPVVVGQSIYQHVRQKPDEEILLCLDVVDGHERWRSSYPAPYKLGGPAHGFEGPRSTPAVVGGRIFTFGISGILSCFDAHSGDVIWRKDFVKQYPETAPGWGTSASPLVTDGLCIVHVGGPNKGGLTAFNAKTGAEKWCYDGDGPAYASPIVADLAGERQVVGLTLNDFVGVSLATGKLLWKIPCREIHSENCLTPVLYKDLVIYAGRCEVPRAIRLERTASGITPKEVWKGDGPTLYMSSPILAGDLLVGLSDRKSGHLFCADAKTGKTLWEGLSRLQQSGALVNAGSAWLALTSGGDLIVVKPSAAGFEQLAKYHVAESHVWTHPVFLGDRFLVKDETTLRSFAIEPAGNVATGARRD
jgi:outer membrane protein assembly factor BamB